MSHSEGILNERMTLSRDGGRENSIGMTVEFRVPSELTKLTIQMPPSVEITDTEGFEAAQSTLTWDEQTIVASVKGRYDPSMTSMGGVQTIDTGDWAVVTRPTGGLRAKWTYTGSQIKYESSYAVNGSGVISSDGAIAYLGPYEEYTRASPSERFKLIVPDAAQLTHDVDAVLACMERASQTLEIGPRNEQVLIIAAPASESNWGPTGTQFGDTGFWALDQAQLTHPNNTWIHEYVHTRQNFNWDDSLLWFIEGTAKYFSAWVGVNQDLIEFEELYQYLTGTLDPDAVLADPSTWANQQTKYTKGATVTMDLAAKLYAQSDGQIGVMDLMQKLCEIESEEPLSIRNWESLFKDQQFPDLSAWVEANVNGRQLPEPPKDPEVYGLTDESSDTPRVGPSSDTDQSDDSEGDSEPEGDEEPTPPETDEEDSTDKDSLAEEDPEKPDISPTRCPICETDVDNGQEYCDACGTKLQRDCFICGAQAPGQEFCPVCGTKLRTSCTVCGYKQDASETYCDSCGTEL